MAVSEVTSQGLINSNNNIGSQEFGYKFMVVGLKVSDGGTLDDAVYTAANATAKRTAMRARTDLAGNKSNLIPVKGSYPIQSSVDDPNWSVTYEFKIDSAETSAFLSIREQGLYGQNIAISSQWDPTENYTANQSYVTWAGATWKCITTMPGSPLWVSGNATYIVNDTVTYNGSVYKLNSLVGFNPALPPSSSTNWTFEQAHTPQIGGKWDWFSDAVDGTVPFGAPYLLMLTIRDQALPMNNEHTIRMTETLSFGQEVSTVVFVSSDLDGGLTEVMSTTIELQAETNRQIRDLAKQIPGYSHTPPIV